MESLLQSGSTYILALTLILIVLSLVVNIKSFKFEADKFTLLGSGLVGILFSGVCYLFNQSLEIIPFVLISFIALLLGLLAQSIREKMPIFLALLSFTAFLGIIKFRWDESIIQYSLFASVLLATCIIPLLKNKKILSNLFYVFTPSLVLIAALAWLKGMNFEPDLMASRLLFLLSTILLGLAFSFSQTILYVQTNKVLKNIGSLVVLALLTYLVLNNFLSLPLKFTLLAVGGFVFAQILHFLPFLTNPNEDNIALESLSGIAFVLLIGFIATRLFGTLGLIVLSITSLAVFPLFEGKKIHWPLLASLFFALKVLTNAFMQNYSLNATGLNLTHTYVYVGLMIGITLPFLIIALPVLKRKTIAGLNYLTVIMAGLVFPALIAYLIHAPAAGSMIIGVSASALILSVSGTTLAHSLKNDAISAYSLAILPISTLMGVTLLNSGTIIEVGTTATRLQRAEILVLVAILSIILYVILQKTGKQENNEPIQSH